MPVNILNLPGLDVVDFRETATEYHVRAKAKAVSRQCPSCGPAGKVVIHEHKTTDLVLDALSMAWFRRRPGPGVLFHSDRGSQYASQAYQARLAAYGMRGSMSRKGNCWDNAPTESFFNSLKNERVHGVSYATRNEATSDLFQYIAVFYNRSRRHSSLGYLSPTTFLQNWIERQDQQEMAA